MDTLPVELQCKTYSSLDLLQVLNLRETSYSNLRLLKDCLERLVVVPDKIYNLPLDFVMDLPRLNRIDLEGYYIVIKTVDDLETLSMHPSLKQASLLIDFPYISIDDVINFLASYEDESSFHFRLWEKEIYEYESGDDYNLIVDLKVNSRAELTLGIEVLSDSDDSSLIQSLDQIFELNEYIGPLSKEVAKVLAKLPKLDTVALTFIPLNPIKSFDVLLRNPVLTSVILNGVQDVWELDFADIIEQSESSYPNITKFLPLSLEYYTSKLDRLTQVFPNLKIMNVLLSQTQLRDETFKEQVSQIARKWSGLDIWVKEERTNLIRPVAFYINRNRI